MGMGDVFSLAHKNFTEKDLVRADTVSKSKLLEYGVELDVLSNYLGVPRQYLYLTGNVIKPVIAWDGKFITLELYNGVEKLPVYENAWIKMKKKVEKLIKEQKYEDIYYLMVSNMRILSFNNTFKEIPKSQVYSIFKYVYNSSEYGFNEFNWRNVEEICESHNQADITFLKEKYGDVLTIYRGEKRSEGYGFSWTLDYEVANFFANRFDTRGEILEGTVNTGDILTYIEREQEVVVNTDKVEIH